MMKQETLRERGGARKGSGRKKLAPTKQMRIPVPLIPAVILLVKNFRETESKNLN
ncbi:MAG: hypothetical protein ABFS56_30680 [Pseudomonadota bacterium]